MRSAKAFFESLKESNFSSIQMVLEETKELLQIETDKKQSNDSATAL